ncbi:hypothetical protein BS78_05G167700 [Paspalum vaginatum]|nr:hypothetical protein BS78_05G167700 [Paspalum vaginatum]
MPALLSLDLNAAGLLLSQSHTTPPSGRLVAPLDSRLTDGWPRLRRAPARRQRRPPAAPTPPTCSRECLRGKRVRWTGERRRRLAVMASARSRTTRSITSSRSCRRRMPCGRACSPGAGATSDRPTHRVRRADLLRLAARGQDPRVRQPSAPGFSSAIAVRLSTHARSGSVATCTMMRQTPL